MRSEIGEVLHFSEDPAIARFDPHVAGTAEPVGDLLALHEAAQIEFRLAPSLWPWWNAVIATTVGFSGVRLRNAQPPRTDSHDTPPHPRRIGHRVDH